MGSHKAKIGNETRITIRISSAIKNGETPLKVSEMSQLSAIEEMTKTFIPTGGVISPTSTTTSASIPNQIFRSPVVIPKPAVSASICTPPLSSTSTLIFMVHVYGNENTNLGDSIAYTLFDGTANTLIGMGYQDATNHGNGNNWNQTSFNCSYSPPDANSRVYRLRASVNHGTYESINSTTYINNARYGRRVKNSITIFEVES